MTASTDQSLPPESSRTSAPGGFIRNVLPALIWTFLLFLGGGGPPPAQQTGDTFGVPDDKILHAAAFAVLGGLVFRALRFEWPLLGRRPLSMLSGVAAAGIGTLLEIYQYALPDRSASVGDAVADAVGAFVAALLLGLIGKK